MKKHTLPPFIIIPSEIMMDSRLTLRHIKVLMAICSWRKSNTNLARISRQMISERTGYPLVRVSAITTALVKLNWIKKTGNGGKSQWSEYEIQDLEENGNDTVTKTVSLGDTKTVSLGDTKTVRGIDTERKYKKKTERKYKKKITYAEKVKTFKPSKATANVFKMKYPLHKNEISVYLELLEQFKDQALNRGDPFKNLDAGFRIYINREYIKPVKQVVRKNEITSFRDIGDTVRAEQQGHINLGLPKQILINEINP